MPTPATRKSKASTRTSRVAPKKTAKRRPSRGPSFGEWVRKYAGMVKNAPSDLSMREGFGD
jgi:hypothetical protein